MGLNKRLIGAGATAGAGGLTPSENFKVVTYTGNGGTQNIDVGFQPDLVWIKNRNNSSNSTFDHSLFDSQRSTFRVRSNSTGAQNDYASHYGGITANGFQVKNGLALNDANGTYVAWCWKANGGTTVTNTDGNITSTVQTNTDSGFSILTYSGTNNGSSATVGTGFDSAVDFVIIKATNSTQAWQVFTNISGVGRLQLNDTGAQDLNNLLTFNSNGTVQFPSQNGAWNENGKNFVAYCFKAIDGFSKFGTYTGNGSANGPIIETGFEPAFVMYKGTGSSRAWIIVDNKRSPANTRRKYLIANSSNAEAEVDVMDFLSNGFQIRDTSVSTNGNGETYIYMAFAADPDTEAPTLASSFDVETYNMTGGSDYDLSFPFKPQFVVTKTRDEAAHWSWGDIIRGNNSNLSSNDNNAVNTSNQWRVKDWYAGATSVTIAQHASTSTSNVSYAWKADDNEATIDEATEDADAVAIYELNQNANDALGNYNGTVTGTANWTSSGKFNYAAQFDSWHINTGHNFSLANNSFSISFWFANSATGSTNSYVISTDGPETQNNHLLIGRRDSNGKLNFAFYANDLNSATDVTTDGTWQHWVCTYNASTNSRKIYLNGSLDASDTASADYQGTGNLEIGFGIYQGLGKVDQVRIYNKELNAASVINLYNETAAQNNTVNIGTKQTNSIEAIVSANANAGFSIAKGSGAGKITIPHGLSAAPNLVIKKGFSITEDWYVYHSAVGTGKYLSFNRNNGTDAPTTRADSFSSVTATSVTDDVTSADVEYIMYSFHDVAGYQKIGSYTGDGNNDRAVTTGFKPDFVMIKSTVGSDNWRMYDTRRGITGGGYLEPNRSDADDTSNAPNLTMTSTGFTITSGGVTAGNNANGNLYIYWAVAKNVPSNTTLANSFKAVTYSGNGGTQSITGTGFKPDLVWIKHRNEANDHVLTDSIRGRGLLYSNGNDAQNQDSQLTSFDSDGFSLAYNTGQNVKFNKSGGTYVAWAWKAGNTWQSNLDGTIASTINANTANGFSIAKWTGNGSAATVGHGLSSAPEMVITKRLSGASDWYTYHKDLNSGTNPAYNFIKLNSSDAEIVNASSGGSIWNSTSPSSTVINIGTSLSGSSDEYVAYCFHSVSGYSKIGSYTGTGATGNTVTVGFQPDFVMVKATGEAEPWFILDSARDTSNPRDNRLMPDSNAAEDDGSVHTMDFNSDNFTLNGTVGNGTNGSSKTYIYMAFKMN